MRANSVPGGTIREGALFFQTVTAAGALFKRGHYSRGGTIRASTVIIIMWTITKYHKSTKKNIFSSKYGFPSVDAFSVSKPPNMVVHDKNGNGVTLRRREKRPGRAKRNC